VGYRLAEQQSLKDGVVRRKRLYGRCPLVRASLLLVLRKISVFIKSFELLTHCYCKKYKDDSNRYDIVQNLHQTAYGILRASLVSSLAQRHPDLRESSAICRYFKPVVCLWLSCRQSLIVAAALSIVITVHRITTAYEGFHSSVIG